MTAVKGVDPVSYQLTQAEGQGELLMIRAWLRKASVEPAGSLLYGGEPAKTQSAYTSAPWRIMKPYRGDPWYLLGARAISLRHP